MFFITLALCLLGAGVFFVLIAMMLSFNVQRNEINLDLALNTALIFAILAAGSLGLAFITST